jgi:mono/diheme cytochrome c family protein
LHQLPWPQPPGRRSQPEISRHHHPTADRQGISGRVPPKAIAEIIRSGSVIGKAPIVSMPHWGTILSDQQVAQLVAYIGTLTSSGH